MGSLKFPPYLLLLSTLLALVIPFVLPIARNMEYEYLSLAAYLSLFCLGLASLLADHRARPKLSQWIWALFASLMIATLPGAVAFTSGLCRCSAQDFWFWFFVQLLPHLLLAQALFVGLWTLRSRGYSRLFCLSTGVLLCLVLLVHLGAVLWMHPQKRITHLLSGFVHGAIYDTWIPVDAGVLWARAAHALIALTLLGLALASRRSQSLAILLAGLVGTWGLLTQAQSYPSQWHGLDALQKLMPESQAGPHFVLHSQKPKTPEEARRLKETFISTSFHLEDLNKQLMSYQRTVHIFVYPSHEAKKLWFGGESTDITDVRTPSIHITLENWPHSTLRHELVHALSSSFAYHGLGFHPNLAFTEGLAVALAPSDDEISLHEGAARILQSERIPDLHHLFSPMFWSASGRRAYTVSGSLVKYMIDRYGIQQMKLLYAGTEWSHIFAEDFDNTLQLWRNFLEVSYPPHKHAMAAESLYRYEGLLADSCAHSKATLAQTSHDSFLAWRRPSDWNPEKDYWQWRESFDKDPRTQLARFRKELDQLWQNFSLSAAEQLRKDLEARIPEHPAYIEDIEYEMLDADLLLALEKREEALTRISRLKELLTTHQLGDPLTRQIWARWLLLQAPPDEAKPWLDLLSGRSKQVPTQIAPEASWIVRYLYLRNHRFGPNNKAQLIAAFDQEFPPDIPASFRIEWYKNIGQQWLRQDLWKWAAPAFLKAAEFAPEGKKEYFKLLGQEAFSRDPRVH